MRFSLIFLLIIFGKMLCGQQFQPTLAIDTTGHATICFPKDSSWSVNIEQYRWNKWVFVKRIEVQREKDTCFVCAVQLHSGTNKFRLRLLRNGRPVSVCCEITITSRFILPAYTEMFGHYGQADTLHLPFVSMWEIYDLYGNLIWQGYSQDIPVKGLLTGDYYLCYDNVTTQFAVYPDEHKPRKE